MMLIGQALRVAQMTSRCRVGFATVLGAVSQSWGMVLPGNLWYNLK